jgi:xanthine phosphoribosyltransferase
VKQYYSYENFRNDTNKLITKVKAFEPEAILSIARGGFTLSHAMAEGLDIRDLQSIRTELYDKECKREELSLFGSCHFEVKRVLVVDDIADSGETLRFIMEYLAKNFPDVAFKSATLFYKKSSCYEPNYWINEADTWIEFFWEKDFICEKDAVS